jgi:hypothetical protein
LSHAPALHYNLGQVYRLRARVGDCGLAREEYQRFVERAAPSPERELAKGYVAQLASCAAVAPDSAHDTKDTPRPSPELPPAPLRRLHTRKLEAAIIGVGGLVVLTAGAALGHHAATLSDEVTHACSMPATPCAWSAETSVDAAGRRDAALGWTLDAVGVAGLIGGAALYWFGVHDVEVQVARVATTATTRSSAEDGVLSWSVRW